MPAFQRNSSKGGMIMWLRVFRLSLMMLAVAVTPRHVNLFAQLPAPNTSGISLGHVHLTVKDPELHKKLWTEIFGAQSTKLGNLELLKLPGIFVLLTKAEPSGGSAGSTVDHFGLAVKDLAATRAKLAAANVEMNSIFAVFPDGVRLELLEDTTIATPAASHHFHLFVADPEALRAWYVKTFGATPGSRRNGAVPSANFTSGEVDFLRSQAPTAPTRGRAIDHIGFEVQNLEAFCKKLEAEGIKFDVPFRDVPQIGLKIAFITDPVGTRIELTEGLAGK
jgi:catechol 2,3-dioxygenase-like lactoylglutathione lyase family enzyme